MTQWLGLTGGIATGKSTVGELLRRHGIPVIDADEMARLALRPGSEIIPKVMQSFGPGILDAQGSIDRKKLGDLVFQDPRRRADLEALVHPFVRQEALRRRDALIAQGKTIVVYDVPLLFEKKMQDQFDQIIVVVCERSIQKKRLMERNQLTEEQAEWRLQSQLSLEEKARLADHVIDNSGTRQQLDSKVVELIGKLQSKNV